MGFADLPKEEREKVKKEMEFVIQTDLSDGIVGNILEYAADSDVDIRKNTYLIIGRFYRDRKNLRPVILTVLRRMHKLKDQKVRQTVTRALGEIGKVDADPILGMLESDLKDGQPWMIKSVIGALKRMGEKNPTPMLNLARKYLHDPDPRIRRQIVHGMELRGRSRPQEVLPLLAEVQNDKNKQVRDTIVHVLGNISYKEGCLEIVVSALKTWKNRELVQRALNYILEVHKGYDQFTAKSLKEAKSYIERMFKLKPPR